MYICAAYINITKPILQSCLRLRAELRSSVCVLRLALRSSLLHLRLLSLHLTMFSRKLNDFSMFRDGLDIFIGEPTGESNPIGLQALWGREQ